MPAKTKEQIVEHCQSERGIAPGVYVSWQPPLGGVNRRYGCVLSFDGVEADGRVVVQASNAKLRIPVDVLRAEPDCEDAIVADQKGIYNA